MAVRGGGLETGSDLLFPRSKKGYPAAFQPYPWRRSTTDQITHRGVRRYRRHAARTSRRGLLPQFAVRGCSFPPPRGGAFAGTADPQTPPVREGLLPAWSKDRLPCAPWALLTHPAAGGAAGQGHAGLRDRGVPARPGTSSAVLLRHQQVQQILPEPRVPNLWYRS